MILERIPGKRFSRVLPEWKGRVVVILGGGPSLKPGHFELVREAREADCIRVIAVNDSYLLAPWADLLHAPDARWHQWQYEGVDKPALGFSAKTVTARWRAYRGQRCSSQWSADKVDDAVHILRNKTHSENKSGVSEDPEAIFMGRCGGAQALNIGTLGGGTIALLCGFDAQPGHWHGQHPTPSNPDVYPEMVEAFRIAAPGFARLGVRVINCAPTSAIKAFEKMTLEDALEEVTA